MLRIVAPFLLTAVLAGCGAVYKVDVYQGNLMEEASIKQLKPGLTKRQVLLLIGSPSVRDPFHQDRWDYVATMSRRGSKPEVKNFTLIFENDALAGFEGDYFPEQDEALLKDLRRYGNLPREKNERRARRMGG